MRKLVFLLITLTISCGTNESDNVGFITRLGTDTVAVETFEFTEQGVVVDVIVRVPELVATRYVLTYDEQGEFGRMNVYNSNPNSPFDEAEELIRQDVRDGDSLRVTYYRDEGNIDVSVPYRSGVVPFIEYTHWPFEVALRENPMQAGDSVTVPMLSGRRVMDFLLTINESGKTVIRHPFRGTMDVVRAGNDGISTLDASATTRKLLVERTENIPIQEIAQQFKKAEENGKAFGELSGAATQEFDVNGASFLVEYGSPLARGRELFGALVPYGERWRTGANRATHMSTSNDLMIGDLNVSAGDYTLFTIPEADGGTFIINKQTGQNGRSYDESRDLGRVEMQRRTSNEYIEAFTVQIIETTNGGEIQLLWGNTVYFVPFSMN